MTDWHCCGCSVAAAHCVAADHDGSHIKGLFFNMIHHFWPELLQRNDFICEFVTPIVKCFPAAGVRKPGSRPNSGKGSRLAAPEAEQGQVISFFTLQEFSKWWGDLGAAERKRWRVKYYKGLGTNSAQEGKEYFANLERHRLDMHYSSSADDDALHLAFSSDADRRKEWLRQHVASRGGDTFVDHTASKLGYFDFVHKELVQFSYAHVQRSIPSMIDGFKPGQRKVLFACFKRKLTSEIKVAQLAGYVAEHTAYHHGEASLHGTIVKMAQRFVGTNNLPLLVASGQFGTRLQGGEDAASPRYIFTQLSPFTRQLMPEADDEMLEHLYDDGVQIEPQQYVPIVPTILLNGAEGIATGWSTNIPMYHPEHVIDAVEACIQCAADTGTATVAWESLPPLQPWYLGFTGRIVAMPSGDGFECHGSFQAVEGKARDGLGLVVHVSELPVGRWTDDFQELLYKLSAEDKDEERPLIESFSHNNTESAVDTTIYFSQAARAILCHEGGSLNDVAVRKLLKLTTKISTKNMYAFSCTGAISQYTDPRQIVAEFVGVRRALYVRRKQLEEALMASRVLRLANQCRFLEMLAEVCVCINVGMRHLFILFASASSA